MLDVMMPVPVVVITATGLRGRLGDAVVLPKPMARAALLDTVRSAAGGRRAVDPQRARWRYPVESTRLVHDERMIVDAALLAHNGK